MENRYQTFITCSDLKKIDEFLESGILVNEMNKAGLSLGAMALILTAIEKECIIIKSELYINGDIDILKEEDNVCWI